MKMGTICTSIRSTRGTLLSMTRMMAYCVCVGVLGGMDGGRRERLVSQSHGRSTSIHQPAGATPHH